MHKPSITALRHKLQQWELRHLRQHATELAERLERAENEISTLRNQLEHTDRCADAWHQQAMAMIDELHQLDIPAAISITQSGEIGVIDCANKEAA